MMQKNLASCSMKLLTTLLFVFFAGLGTTSIVAAEEQSLFNTHIHIGNDGLAVQHPVISQTEILNTLTQAHRLLSLQSEKAQSIIAKDSSGSNMIFAAIIPGGLIYLAFQRSKIAKAKTTLTEIESELENLDLDAVSLYQPVYKPTSQAALVARYP